MGHLLGQFPEQFRLVLRLGIDKFSLKSINRFVVLDCNLLGNIGISLHAIAELFQYHQVIDFASGGKITQKLATYALILNQGELVFKPLDSNLLDRFNFVQHITRNIGRLLDLFQQVKETLLITRRMLHVLFQLFRAHGRRHRFDPLFKVFNRRLFGNRHCRLHCLWSGLRNLVQDSQMFQAQKGRSGLIRERLGQAGANRLGRLLHLDQNCGEVNRGLILGLCDHG